MNIKHEAATESIWWSKKILWGKLFSENLPIWLEWQDSYLSIVEDDRTDKSPSTTSHLTTVDQILQFTDLHCTLKAEQKWRKRRKEHLKKKKKNLQYTGDRLIFYHSINQELCPLDQLTEVVMRIKIQFQHLNIMPDARFWFSANLI